MTGNIHTGHHDLDENGLSPEIEGYINQSCEWVQSHMGVPGSVLDAGCDYGHALKVWRDRGVFTLKGIELYAEKNPYKFDISRESLEDPLLPAKLKHTQYDLVFVNHVLEHLYNPYSFMKSMNELKPKHIYIAVPHAKEPWALWEGHYTIWTPEWLEHFMKLNGWKQIAGAEMVLRPGHTEIWGLFECV